MKLGNKSVVSDKAKIVFPENLLIGNNCRIDDNCLIICKEKVVIGNFVHIGPNSIIRAHQKISIGDYSLISSFADIYTEINYLNDGSFSHPLYKKKNSKNKPLSDKLKIGKFSQIGSHSVILPGAYIGEGVIVGALTLINFKTKNWSIYHGNPAKYLGKREREKSTFFYKK